LKPKAIQVKELTQNSILQNSELASRKNISIVYLNEEDPSIAFSDDRMIQTVLRNLIVNAIKFTGKDGKITLDSSFELTPGFCTITIKDTGIGMVEDQIAKLFNLEEMYSTKGTDGEASTGLGLIMCKDFVERNKGKIWVESQIGKGSVFYFTIPIGIG
jgi:signal transduction histidine kinase